MLLNKLNIQAVNGYFSKKKELNFTKIKQMTNYAKSGWNKDSILKAFFKKQLFKFKG